MSVSPFLICPFLIFKPIIVVRIIRHLELTFVAEKQPPAHAFEQIALMAAEESGGYDLRRLGSGEWPVFYGPLPRPTRPKIRRRQPGRLDFEMLTTVRGRDILLFVMGRVDPEVEVCAFRSNAKRKLL